MTPGKRTPRYLAAKLTLRGRRVTRVSSGCAGRTGTPQTPQTSSIRQRLSVLYQRHEAVRVDKEPNGPGNNKTDPKAPSKQSETNEQAPLDGTPKPPPTTSDSTVPNKASFFRWWCPATTTRLRDSAVNRLSKVSTSPRPLPLHCLPRHESLLSFWEPSRPRPSDHPSSWRIRARCGDSDGRAPVVRAHVGGVVAGSDFCNARGGPQDG